MLEWCHLSPDRPPVSAPGRVHHLRRTSRLVLLAGIFLAALTFIVVIYILGSGPGGPGGPGTQPTQSTSRDVVVAAVDSPLGTGVAADMLGITNMSVDIVKSGAFQDKSQVIGSKTVVSIAPGAPGTAAQFNGTGPGGRPPGPG